MPTSDYAKDLGEWRSSLDLDIRRDLGLLALSGQFWLEKGVSTIGSSRDCTICLPKPIPRLLGAFEFDGSRVKFHVDVGQTVEVDGAPVQSVSQLRFEDEPRASVLRSGDIALGITRHEGRVGVRVWAAARARDFPPRSWFDVDERYRLRAIYTPYPAAAAVKMPDNLGGIQQGYVQGYVSFKLEGKTFNVDATEPGDGRLFVQFRDRTNGVVTYPEGRYLDTEAVAEDGTVIVDFNRARNPAAAFTTFTFCTFAPKENVLNCAVEAGERFAGTPAGQT